MKGDSAVKKTILLCVTAIILFASTMTSLAAGWKQDQGNWYYEYDNGQKARNIWIGNYYVGNEGWMCRDEITPDGYYVNTDGSWDGQPSLLSEDEMQLYNCIKAAYQDSLIGGWAIRDFNRDGKNEIVIQVTKSVSEGKRDRFTGETIDTCYSSYWYSDGVHIYSFGEEDVTNEYIYAVNFGTILTSEGNDLFVNIESRPMAWGGYMERSAIYRLSDTGAKELFRDECCTLINPQFESITEKKYEPVPGMTNVDEIKILNYSDGVYQ